MFSVWAFALQPPTNDGSVHLRLGNFHHRKGSNTMKTGQHQKYRCPRHPPWKRRSHGGVSTMNGGVRGVEIHPVSSISKTWCLSHPAVHSHGEDQLSKSNQPTVILGIHPGNRCKFYSLDMDTTAWVWNRSVDLTWAAQMPKLCNQDVLVSQTKALTCLDHGHHFTRQRHKPSQDPSSTSLLPSFWQLQ